MREPQEMAGIAVGGGSGSCDVTAVAGFGGSCQLAARQHKSCERAVEGILEGTWKA